MAIVRNNQQDNVTTAAVASIAAASQTPFKTAFKVTMGIFAAQLVVGLLFIAGCASIAAITYSASN